MGCYPVFSKCSATRPSHNLHPVTCLHPKSPHVKRPQSSHVHTQILPTSRIHPSATHLLSNKGFPDKTQTSRAVYYNSEKTHRSRAFSFLPRRCNGCYQCQGSSIPSIANPSDAPRKYNNHKRQNITLNRLYIIPVRWHKITEINKSFKK